MSSRSEVETAEAQEQGADPTQSIRELAVSKMGDVELHMLVGEIHADVKTLLKSYPDIDKRVRKVERQQSWTMGIGLVVAAVAAKMGFADLTGGFFHQGG